MRLLRVRSTPQPAVTPVAVLQEERLPAMFRALTSPEACTQLLKELAETAETAGLLVHAANGLASNPSVCWMADMSALRPDQFAVLLRHKDFSGEALSSKLLWRYGAVAWILFVVCAFAAATELCRRCSSHVGRAPCHTHSAAS